MLELSRREIERLVEADEANDLFQSDRAKMAATQALAFAAWAEDPPSPLSDRRNRMTQAEGSLNEAKRFSRNAKSKEAEARVALAHAGITAAKLRLIAGNGGYGEP